MSLPNGTRCLSYPDKHLLSAGSAFANWDVTDPAAIALIKSEVFELEEPGTDPVRQEAPHPHQATIDPTGQYILVPDLGADLVRVYAVGDDLSLTPVEPLATPAGSGPRHGAFVVTGDSTFFYLVTELGNTILGYSVTYREGFLVFQQVYESSTHGKGEDVPYYVGAAEIIVSVSPTRTCHRFSLIPVTNKYKCSPTRTSSLSRPATSPPS